MDIEQHGLVLEDLVSGARSVIPIDTVERLLPDDHYDLVIVAVRRDQLDTILPDLSANRRVPAYLFLLNNPLGLPTLIKLLGDRVLLGFPGAGGTRDDHTVRYAMISQQPTTLGEPGGRDSIRLNEVVKAFRGSGLRTRRSRDMDAWLKTHAFFVTSVCGAIYLAGGNCMQLSRDKPTLRLMVNGVREGFCAIQALGLTVAPFALRVLFTWLPPTFAVNYWRRFFATNTADYVFGRHSRAASAEMRELANDCRMMMQGLNVKKTSVLQLFSAIDAYARQHKPTTCA